MQQPNEQPLEPVQSSKNIWLIIASIIVTALIVGGGVYAWQKSNLKFSFEGENSSMNRIWCSRNHFSIIISPVDFLHDGQHKICRWNNFSALIVSCSPCSDPKLLCLPHSTLLTRYCRGPCRAFPILLRGPA